jgi:hypothetical protein
MEGDIAVEDVVIVVRHEYRKRHPFKDSERG